jgi:hypothetical protein
MGKVPASRYLPVYRLKSDTVARLLRAIVFFGLVTPAIASETLNVLVNAAASFSATIQQQLENAPKQSAASRACRKDD